MSRSVLWLTAWLFLLAGLWAGVSGASAQDASSLTLQVYVCPEGVEPADPGAECAGHPATTYAYEIYAGPTRDTSEAVAEGIAAGSADVTVDLTGLVPGFVIVGFPDTGSMLRGAVSFGCSINGTTVDSVRGIDNTTYPMYEVQVDQSGELACTIFMRGFAGDTEYFGIVEDTPTDASSDDSSVTANSSADASDTDAATAGPNVSALPATGTGHAPAGLPIELAGFGVLLAAGAVVLRRWFVIR